MDLQHFIACSGVVIAPQSNAYPVRATPSKTIRIERGIRIDTKLVVRPKQVKAICHCYGKLTLMQVLRMTQGAEREEISNERSKVFVEDLSWSCYWIWTGRGFISHTYNKGTIRRRYRHNPTSPDLVVAEHIARRGFSSGWFLMWDERTRNSVLRSKRSMTENPVPTLVARRKFLN